MPIVLVIKDKEDVHSVLLTSRPIVLGRSGASDVRISDEKVSGKHLALKLNSQGRVMIKDLETTNGTLLNGANIDEGHLMIADKLTIGDVQLSLDESQMSPREKKPLTRDDAPTQIKYIRMPGDTAPSKKLKRRQENTPQKPTPDPAPEPDSKKEEEDSPTVVFSEDEVGDNNKSDKKSESKNRLIESAEKLSKNHEPDDNVSLGTEGQFEMDEPSGSTQMLKMSVNEQVKSSKTGAKKIKKKPSKRKKPEKPEKKSLLQGLFQMFKG